MQGEVDGLVELLVVDLSGGGEHGVEMPAVATVVDGVSGVGELGVDL